MAHVMNGNVFLTIPDSEIDRYMAKGFNIVDENGRVLEHALPNTVGDLQLMVKKLEAKIAELEEYIASLEIVEEDEVEDEVVEEEKPAKKSRKKPTE